MATTTVTAIRTALETVITGLTPKNTAHGRSAFQVKSEYRGRSRRSPSDIDREFSIDDIPPGTVLEFGLTSERLHETSLDVQMGHSILADEHEAMGRRDDDLADVVDALQSKGNFPSGVWLITPDGSVTNVHEEKFWLTTLSLRMIYTRAI